MMRKYDDPSPETLETSGNLFTNSVTLGEKIAEKVSKISGLTNQIEKLKHFAREYCLISSKLWSKRKYIRTNSYEFIKIVRVKIGNQQIRIFQNKHSFFIFSCCNYGLSSWDNCWSRGLRAQRERELLQREYDDQQVLERNFERNVRSLTKKGEELPYRERKSYGGRQTTTEWNRILSPRCTRKGLPIYRNSIPSRYKCAATYMSYSSRA